MWAGVEHRLEIALAVTGEQDVAASDRTGDEVAGFGEFRAVAEIEPAICRISGRAPAPEWRIDEGLPGNLENLPRFIDQKRCLHRPNRIHRSASLDQLILSACRRSYAVDSTSDRSSRDCLQPAAEHRHVLAALIEIAPTISLPRIAATEKRCPWCRAHNVVGIDHVADDLDVEIVLIGPDHGGSLYSRFAPAMLPATQIACSAHWPRSRRGWRGRGICSICSASRRR